VLGCCVVARHLAPQTPETAILEAVDCQDVNV
jgi:hypothetical protein